MRCGRTYNNCSKYYNLLRIISIWLIGSMLILSLITGLYDVNVDMRNGFVGKENTKNGDTLGRWIVKFNSTIETGNVLKPDVAVPQSRGTIVNEMVSNCQKHPPRTKNINDQTKTFSNIVVDDSKRLMYCSIPKVASTNWKRTLMMIRAHSNVTDTDDLLMMPVHQDVYLRAVGFKFLNDYSAEDIKYRIRNYYKFIFVRHPIERLVSAYKDKFMRSNKWTKHFHRKYGRDIIRTYRENASDTALKFGHNVRFSEFIQYIIDMHKLGGELNKHWDTYDNLCQPCFVRYNYVGKLEHINADSSDLLQHICNGNCSFSFPEIGIKGHSLTTHVTSSIESRLPVSQLRDIEEVYQKDMDLFGYESKAT